MQEQLEFLRTSAAAYDAGAETEGKRLAVVLRTLLHTTGQQISLLEQLGIQEVLKFVDTAAPIAPGNLLPTPGLVLMEMGPSGVRYVPPLCNLSPGRRNPPKPFALWSGPRS